MRNCLHLNAVDLSKGLAVLDKHSTSLCTLENAKSVAYNSFQGPQKSWAQLQIGSSQLVPATTRKSWDSVSVSVGIVGGEIAPRLQLTALVGNENRKTIHVGSLCFFPGGTLDARGQILNPTLTQDEQIGGVYKLTFQSNGGIGSARTFGLRLGL